MKISRILAILIVFGVPVIVGGGIVYSLFDSFPAMFAYELLVGFTALGFAFKDGIKLG